MHNILLLLLAIALGSALPTQAASAGKRAKVQSQPLPVQQAVAPEAPQAPMVHYQAPPTLPNGNPNLIHYWYEYGGARLYWQGLLDPQQVKLLGPAWRDPAQHAQLTDTGYGGRQGTQGKRTRRSKKTASVKNVACPNKTSCPKPAACSCANTAACGCSAPQNQGKTATPAAQSNANATPNNAATQGNAARGNQRAYQLAPGPKPTTYTEVSPKAAATVGQNAPSANASPALPAPAPLPALAPTPLVPAAQPTTAATQTSGNSTGRISQQ